MNGTRNFGVTVLCQYAKTEQTVTYRSSASISKYRKEYLFCEEKNGTNASMKFQRWITSHQQHLLPRFSSSCFRSQAELPKASLLLE